MSKIKYNTIKWVLRQHIKNKVESYWIWLPGEFVCIYKYTTLNTEDRIYTPAQLLNVLCEQ